MKDDSLKYYLEEYTPEQVRRMVPMNNNVIINVGTINAMEPFIKYKSLTLINDPSFKPEWHAITIGKVVKAPKRLTVGLSNGGMQWKTSIEIIPGDEVLFSFDNMLRVYKKQNLTKAFICREELYILVNYSELYAAKRNTVPIMLNGFCLIEPMLYEWEIIKLEGVKLGNLVVPDNVKSKKGRYGKIVRIGTHNEYYLGANESKNYMECSDDVAVGDIVWLSSGSDILIENPGFEKFFDDKQYYRAQRRRINGIIKVSK